MPEGHTLHRLAGELTSVFGGRPVAVGSPQGRFATEAAELDGEVLLGAEAWGKHLFVAFPGERYVHVHLGLIGHFDVRCGAAPAPVGQVRLRIDSGEAYADLRGAIVCDLVGPGRRASVLGSLGPDPLRPDADADRAWQKVRRSSRPIGDLLLDQAVVAGIGNVYRAEVLFRHRMHPLRPGRTLRSGQFRSIWDDLAGLMAEGVRTGRIDTVHTEHTPEAMGRPPRVDDHGGEVYVYRRDGQPCLVCGSLVRTEVLLGRNLFWCPRCQPRFRSRAVQ
jgi:endonuclease-8